jgi:hypothetical protein
MFCTDTLFVMPQQIYFEIDESEDKSDKNGIFEACTPHWCMPYGALLLL